MLKISLVGQLKSLEVQPANWILDLEMDLGSSGSFHYPLHHFALFMSVLSTSATQWQGPSCHFRQRDSLAPPLILCDIPHDIEDTRCEYRCENSFQNYKAIPLSYLGLYFFRIITLNIQSKKIRQILLMLQPPSSTQSCH